jgi:hypothetical protein
LINVDKSNSSIYSNITNIYGLLSLVNVFKNNPEVLKETFFEKIEFLKVVANDSILDCFIIESALLQSSLQITFTDKVRISHLIRDQRIKKGRFIEPSLRKWINFYKKYINQFFTFKSNKVFDSSTDVMTLIKQGTTRGDNLISFNGEIYKSTLLNMVVQHGKKFFS